MQFGGGGIPPVGVLFDGAFDGIGDLLALAVLYGLQSKGEARVAAISVNRPDFSAAQFCDVVRRYYSGGGFGGFPLGAADGKQQPLPAYAKLLAETGEDGAPVYKPELTRFIDSADPATVLRNALTASQPRNSIVIASGSPATAVRLLGLRGSKPLIEGTVRYLVLADPKTPTSDAVKLANYQRLFDEWPTPVYVCGGDIGEAIRYPAASIEKDFTGPKENPIAGAYRAFGEMPYDAPTAAADAALFAVRSSPNYFELSGPGSFRVSAGGGLEFEPSANGKQRRLIFDETKKDAIVKALTQLASAPPRGGGRRGGRGEAKDAEPAAVKKK